MSKSTARPLAHRWFAATYDFLAGLDKKKIDPLRDMLAGSASGRVVEIGAGTGLNFPHFDWSKMEHLDVTEPDIYMLRRARERADELPAETRAKVELHDSPAEALPFPDSSMDSAVATLVYCTVTDPEVALSEAWRVLRPGGGLYLLEHVAAEGFTGTVQRVIQPVYGWFSAGCQLGRHTEDMATAAGFDLEVTERLKLGPWPAFAGVARKPG